MNKEIKAIIFDVGGTLSNSNKDLVRKKLAEKYNLDSNLLLKEILNHHKNFLTGKINYADYIKEITEAFKIQDFNKFSEDWEYIIETNFEINSDLLRLIKKLREEYFICSLSNVTPLFEKVRIKKRLYEDFDIKISSFEQGIEKPDPEFYKILISSLNLKPEACIFIDDKEKNLLPAQNLGLNTILFKTNKPLIKDLKNLGVKI